MGAKYASKPRGLFPKAGWLGYGGCRVAHVTNALLMVKN